MKHRTHDEAMDKAHLNPTQIYRTHSADGNPALSSFRAILDAMEMRLTVESKHHNLVPG